MQNVLSVVRTVLATLCMVELASALCRLRHREARREAGWLALLLAAFAGRLLAPRGPLVDVVIPIAVVALTVDLLLAVNRRAGARVWTAVALACVVLLAAVGLAGIPAGTLRWIGLALLVLLSAPAIALLVAVWSKTGEPADFFLLLAAAAWDAATCVEAAGLVPPGSSDWLVAPLLLIVGYMLFEQGYLSPLTSSGYVDRLAAERRLMRRTYARLLESRNALVLQDRLIAAGLLALGAAHEFRDMLGDIRLAAERGRCSSGAEQKDRCLELVAENAAAGGSEAAELLERLGREGREEACRLDIRQVVERLIRIARPSWRPTGITISAGFAGSLLVNARPREVEQILLNLLRNAVDAIEASSGCAREIEIVASAAGAKVEVAVSDRAGGIPAEIAQGLFALGRSGTGSTGIGLYLAKDLAIRNGGALSYRPLPDGSSFVLSLPMARN
jgi:signal transduction histidine kinase